MTSDARVIALVRIALPRSTLENAWLSIHGNRDAGRTMIESRSDTQCFARRLPRGAALSAALAVVVFTSALLAQEETADPDPARFAADIQAFEAWDRQNSFPASAVLFVGSSSIRMWQTAESFPDLPVINRGFGGSHISDVNHFADRVVLKYEPAVVVFYAGDNDIADGKTPEQVSRDFSEFVARLHQRLPATKVLYLPIKPSLLRWERWPQMQKANALVHQTIRGDDRLTYVDTATPMLGSDGRPRAELFLDDGLHLNVAGYQLWNGLVGPVIERARSAADTQDGDAARW
jgi:lysophospholipase L1-like esterase